MTLTPFPQLPNPQLPSMASLESGCIPHSPLVRGGLPPWAELAAFRGPPTSRA